MITRNNHKREFWTQDVALNNICIAFYIHHSLFTKEKEKEKKREEKEKKSNKKSKKSR